MGKYTETIIFAIIGALLGFLIVFMAGGKDNLKGGKWTAAGIVIVFALLSAWAGYYRSHQMKDESPFI